MNVEVLDEARLAALMRITYLELEISFCVVVLEK